MIDFEETGADLEILLKTHRFLHDHFPAFGGHQIRRVMGQDAGKAALSGDERVQNRSLVGGALRRDDLQRIRCGHKFLSKAYGVRSTAFRFCAVRRTSCLSIYFDLLVSFHYVLDAACHIEALFGNMIEFASEDLLEARDRVLERNISALAARERFRHKKGL